MTAAHARLLLEALEAWHGAQGNEDGAAFVGRTVARLPDVTGFQRVQARQQLEAAAVFQRGGLLTPWGRSLAVQVGAAVHSGSPLPDLPGALL